MKPTDRPKVRQKEKQIYRRTDIKKLKDSHRDLQTAGPKDMD